MKFLYNCAHHIPAFRAEKVVLVCSILISFMILYIPRYTQELVMRRNMSREKEVKVEGVLYDECDTYLQKCILQMGNIQLLMPDRLQIPIGKKITAVGRVDETLQIEKSHQIRLIIHSIQDKNRNEDSGKYSVRVRLEKAVRALRRKVETSAYTYLRPEEAQLALGILWGFDIPRESHLYRKLQDLGLSHIAVASGANLVITAGLVHSIFRHFFRLKTAIILAIFSVFLYALFSGFEPSMVRALSFFVILKLGQFFGRKAYALYVLLLCIMGILVYDPFIVYAVSFQLSVLSCVALLTLLPALFPNTLNLANKQARGNLVTFTLVESLQASIATYIFTLPLLIFTFESLSVPAVVANVMVTWMIPVIMLFAGIATLVSLVHVSVLEAFFYAIVWGIESVFIGLINLIYRFPIHTIRIEKPSLIGLLTVYIIFMIGILLRTSRRKK